MSAPMFRSILVLVVLALGLVLVLTGALPSDDLWSFAVGLVAGGAAVSVAQSTGPNT